MTGTILSIPLSSARINMAIFKHSSDSSPILPLSRTHPTASPGRPFRSTTRRLSYHLKNRAGRHAYALSIGIALALMFLYLTFTQSSSGSVLPYSSRSTNNDKLHFYNRDKKVAEPKVEYNGVSLLIEDEDELIAEDGLWVDTYIEPEHTPEEIDHEAIEREERRQDVLKHDRIYSLSALVYFLAEGGIFPHDFKVPSADALEKLGGRGFEKLLNQADRGEDGDLIFSPGWRDYASRQYRIVVFSKTYCPFSKRAKNILSKYMLTPGPFIIELDRRSDMDKLQTLLHRLTSRRTVPNILFDFESIGGADELQMLDGEGGLHKRFDQMGVLPGFKRRFSPARFNDFAPAAAAARPDRVPAQLPDNEAAEQEPRIVADALEGNAPALHVQGAGRVVQGVVVPAGSGEQDDNEEWEKDEAYLDRLMAKVGGGADVDKLAAEVRVEEVQEAEDSTDETAHDGSPAARGNAGRLAEKVQLEARQPDRGNANGKGRRGRGRVVG